jgi:hypothetical protein
METNKTPNGGFYMLTEEIRFDTLSDNAEDNNQKVAYRDDDFYPDASF